MQVLEVKNKELDAKLKAKDVTEIPALKMEIAALKKTADSSQVGRLMRELQS